MRVSSTSDLLLLLAAAHGNNMLVKGGAADTAHLEDALGVDFSGSNRPGLAPLHFRDAPDAEPRVFADWVEALRKRDVEGFLVADEKSAGLARPAPKVEGHEIEERMLHAFVGSPGLLLGAVSPDRVDLLVPRVGWTRRTLITVEDFDAFIEKEASRAELRARMLWEDLHNLKLSGGESWDGFLAAIREGDLDQVVNAMSRAVSNTAFRAGEDERWYRLLEEKRNPDHHAVFQVVGVREVPRWRISTDVAEQAQRLRAALERIRDYAARAGHGNWEGVFAKALSLLEDDPSAGGFATLFQGCGLAPGALRLLSASVAADVFGGMGSWNDLGDDTDDYRTASEALFRELAPSLQVAVNSFWGPRRGA